MPEETKSVRISRPILIHTSSFNSPSSHSKTSNQPRLPPPPRPPRPEGAGLFDAQATITAAPFELNRYARASQPPHSKSPFRLSQLDNPLPPILTTASELFEHIREPQPLRPRRSSGLTSLDLHSLSEFAVTSEPSQPINRARSSSTKPAMEPSTYLDPVAALEAITQQKSDAIRLAREQADAVAEMSRRSKTEVPPYSFEELIGKGAYGRVYKG